MHWEVCSCGDKNFERKWQFRYSSFCHFIKHVRGTLFTSGEYTFFERIFFGFLSFFAYSASKLSYSFFDIRCLANALYNRVHINS